MGVLMGLIYNRLKNTWNSVITNLSAYRLVFHWQPLETHLALNYNPNTRGQSQNKDGVIFLELTVIIMYVRTSST